MSAPLQVETTQDQPLAVGGGDAAGGVGRQLLFRLVNEEIRQIATGFAVADALELVCECEQGDCFALISVPVDAYEAVRRFPTHFLVNPEHVGLDERIVEEAALFAVVEKVGRGAETAILRDPRKRAAQNRARRSA